MKDFILQAIKKKNYSRQQTNVMKQKQMWFHKLTLMENTAQTIQCKQLQIAIALYEEILLILCNKM